MLLINGPNLDLLGIREPEIYGSETLADIEARVVALGVELGVEVECVQSNSEGDLINAVHRARGMDGIVLNSAAYSHYSYALRDAVTAAEVPCIEVHISNIHAREEFRHHSVVSAVATGVICGLGAKGYELALEAMAEMLASAQRG